MNFNADVVTPLASQHNWCEIMLFQWLSFTYETTQRKVGLTILHYQWK